MVCYMKNQFAILNKRMSTTETAGQAQFPGSGHQAMTNEICYSNKIFINN